MCEVVEGVRVSEGACVWRVYLLVKAIVFLNDDLKIMGQYKRNSLSAHTKLDLEVP